MHRTGQMGPRVAHCPCRKTLVQSYANAVVLSNGQALGLYALRRKPRHAHLGTCGSCYVGSTPIRQLRSRPLGACSHPGRERRQHSSSRHSAGVAPARLRCVRLGAALLHGNLLRFALCPRQKPHVFRSPKLRGGHLLACRYIPSVSRLSHMLVAYPAVSPVAGNRGPLALHHKSAQIVPDRWSQM